MEKRSDKGQILIELMAFMILFTLFMIAISEQLRWAENQRQKSIQQFHQQYRSRKNS